jgi:DNA invertase Pin-like site-specific DNA recombinase
MNVAILTRVSKDSQSYQRQITDLRTHAKKQGFKIIGEFNEKISGATKNEERSAIIGLYELIDSEKIDKILVWELSRLGRSTLEVLKSLERFHEKRISLYVHNYCIETLNPDGTINAMAQMMITLLAEFARTERVNIQQRLSSGYQKFRAEGGKVGRKSGTPESKDDFLKKHNDVVKLLKKNTSIRNISKLTEKSTKTIQKVKNIIAN